MPIYEYERPDGTTFEVFQGFEDDQLTKDPETGVPVKRVLHAPAVHFKGSGFYNTDYGTRKRQREQSAGGGGADSGQAAKKDSAGDGKAAKGTDAASSTTAKPAASASDGKEKPAKKGARPVSAS